MNSLTGLTPSAVRFGMKPASIGVKLSGIDPGNSITRTLSLLTQRPKMVIMRSQAELDDLWQAKAMDGLQKPSVDFAKQAALLVLLPEGREIASVDYRNNATLSVNIKPLNPMPLTTSMKYPWGLMVVDKGQLQQPPSFRDVPTYMP